MFIIASFKMSKIKMGIEPNVWHWGVPWNQTSLMDSCAVSENDGFQDCAQEQKKEAELSMDQGCEQMKRRGQDSAGREMLK